MTSEAKDAANRLYHRLNMDFPKEEEKPVRTVGVAKTVRGNEALIVLYKRGPVMAPEAFEGFPVIVRQA